MKVKCSKCNTIYTVDESKITKEIAKVRCKKCRNILTISKNPHPPRDHTNNIHPQSLRNYSNYGSEQVNSDIRYRSALERHNKANFNEKIDTKDGNCFYHADLKGVYKCTSCLKSFCKDCIKERHFRMGEKLFICPECGELAELIKTGNSVLDKKKKPDLFWYDIPDLLIFPVVRGNVYSLIGASIIMVILSFFPFFGDIISYGIAMSYLFLIIENIANGKDNIPTPDFTSIWDDIISPAWLGLCAVVIPFLPLIYHLFFQEVSPPLTDSLSIAFLLIGIFLSPISLMIAALNKRVIDILNPVRIVNIISRIPIDYFISVILITVLFFFWQLAVNLISATTGNVFILNRIAENILFLYFLFIIGRMLGLVIYQNAEKLNYL